MSRESITASRVGLVVLVAIGVGVAALLVLGDRQNMFVRKNHYWIRFENTSGLAAGSTVQLSGVKVGSVDKIVLPSDLEQAELDVWISVAKRYEQRIRQDSVARIKTLGLLGDKYLEITSGSPGSAAVPEGGQIAAAPITDVDRLASAGEDVVNNIARISHQMADILGRIERGEGLLGKLLVDDETGTKMSDELTSTMTALRKLAEGLDDRRGTLGRLVHDRELADRLSGSIDKLDTLLNKVESGDGILPGLLNDAEQKARFDHALQSFDQAAEKLASITAALDKPGSNALVPKLLHDDEYGKRLSDELDQLLGHLRDVAQKLDQGDGSAARLINDPQFAEALEDILVGVNESRMLRWLIRNRQKKGIQKKFHDAGGAPDAEGAETGVPPPPTGP
jgi:phospholipid/cholesterol/gamma-HCH transport system substrate-binding protein